MSEKRRGLKNRNISNNNSSFKRSRPKDQDIIIKMRPSESITLSTDNEERFLINSLQAQASSLESNRVDQLDIRRILTLQNCAEPPPVIPISAEIRAVSERAKIRRKDDPDNQPIFQYILREVEKLSDSEHDRPKEDILDKSEVMHCHKTNTQTASPKTDPEWQLDDLEIQPALSWGSRVIPIDKKAESAKHASSAERLLAKETNAFKTERWSQYVAASYELGLGTYLKDGTPKERSFTQGLSASKHNSLFQCESPTFKRQNTSSTTISRLPVLILEDGNYANLHGFTTRHTERDHFAPFKASNTVRMINAGSEATDLAYDIRNVTINEEETQDTLPSGVSVFNIAGIKLKAPTRRMTIRKKKKKKKRRRLRKWEKRHIGRMDNRINKIRGRKSYYKSFFSNSGRANPWRSMIMLFLWTTLIYIIDKNYLAFGEYIGISDLGISSDVHQLLGIALGFLLYMQASVSSTRWWQGRLEWQNIMEKNKRLSVLLHTHLNCIPLSRYGTRMIVAHSICVWSFLQDKSDETWQRELSEVINGKTVARIMASSRRLRPLSVTYAFQRLVELCIHYRVLEKEVVRDINPILVSLGESFDNCNRCRIAQLPWIMAVHLNFVVFGFVALLPLTLIGRANKVPDKVLTWVEENKNDIGILAVYLYVIIVGYAFFGLYIMAVDIEDPFSYMKESHSFGLWGLIEYWTALNITDIRHIMGYHIYKNEEGDMNENGEYGDYWTVVRLESAIKRALERKILRNPEVVEEQLKENHRDSAYWNGFADLTIKNRDESTEIYFSTEEEDGEELQEAGVPTDSPMVD